LGRDLRIEGISSVFTGFSSNSAAVTVRYLKNERILLTLRARVFAPFARAVAV
jgi:hypothetical protein